MSSYAGYLVETLVTLVAVGALALIVLRGARRLGVGRSVGAIDLYGRLAIDARRSIVLVKVGPQVLVVGVGEGGFTKLGELPAADLQLAAPADAREAPFSEVLGRALARSSLGRGRPEPTESEP